MIHSFNVQIIIDTSDSKATIVIPKGMEKVMGAQNAVETIHGLSMTRLANRSHQGKLIKTNTIPLKILRTCCGCEEKTFYNQATDECLVCGRTNHP